ncbi:MAG: hypothetical protein ABW170_10170 [Candidatus Thiodiazotropha sp. L084R]
MSNGQSKIKPGTVADFTDSMAAAMENALRQEYEAIKDVPMPDTPDEDRHMLFVAIAQGVVGHLIDNLGAITVSVTTTQDDPLAIQSKNGNVEVTQVDEDDNRVNSSGDGGLTIETEGVLYQ